MKFLAKSPAVAVASARRAPRRRPIFTPEPTHTAATFAIAASAGVLKLDEHLRSADFFDVDKFPTATLKTTAFELGLS